MIESEMRCSSGSMESTRHSTASPSLMTSPTLRIWREAISETCTRPSIPGSSFTKAPNCAMRLTVPRTVAPRWYFSPACFQGLATRSRTERPIFPVCRSIFLTTTFIFWPRVSKSAGVSTRSQDNWLTCTSPSTPLPISTKAPKSRTDRTIPSSVSPISSVSSIFVRASAASLSTTARRESTSFLAAGTISVTRLSKVWPMSSARFSMRHGLMRLAGMKPRKPPTSHSRPPLFEPVTRASTIMPAWICDQSSTLTARLAKATS